jgi:aminopeptidase N
MPGPNISKTEAEERSKHLSIASYDVSIKVVPGVETFYSKSIINFSCHKPGYNTFVDASARKIISATLNGSPIDVSAYDGESVALSNLATENVLVIEMEAIFSKNGEGLQYSVDPADGAAYVYSQGAPSLMRHMYACFDQPDLKATFALTATVPSEWVAIGNTTPTSTVPGEDGYSTWIFPPTPRLATYITVFIAGPYHHVHDEYIGQKKVPLGIYCRKSLANHLDKEEIFKVTKQGFTFFEKVFGLAYPFEKYDQIAVVDFNWGAMENVGAVTFKEELFVFRSKVTQRQYMWRANTILHEMTHMWFGNMVTMRWWDDLWLNESFAEWAAYVALDEGTDYKNGWTEFNSRRKNWAYRQDQLSSTHPIVVAMNDIEEANANFDGITYAKGASVLQQFVAHVGRDNFIAGLQRYFAKHAFGNTTLADLVVELEATSGRDLAQWTATWLQTAGVNTLRPAVEIVDGKYSFFYIIQSVPSIPADSKELRPHRLAVGLYDLTNGRIQKRRSVELDMAGMSTAISEYVGEPEADLIIVNDGDMTYAKMRFDEKSIETLKSHLGAIDDSLARALCLSASWDMLRDAEISSEDFVDIVLAGLPNETEISVVTSLGEQLATAVDLYTRPEKRITLRARVAESLLALLESAPSGSDRQLQFARLFATLATTSTQNSRIAEILSGSLAGLSLDTDLRWHLVGALAERGLISQSEIDTERANDASTQGELNHAYALAAQPSPEAKAKAWAQAIDEAVANAVRVANMRGFNRPLQDDLVSPYTDNYFDILLTVWGGKSFEAATEFVEQMFPTFVATQSTLDKTTAWLEGVGKDSPAALRRLVSEARDGLARALRVQAV